MDWLEILTQVVEVCVIPLLGVLTACAIKWIRLKSEELMDKSENELHDKYIAMLTTTITDCVAATTQTYVEALKKDNTFTEEAQKAAFEQTFNAVMSILSEDAREYLSYAIGDLNTYITTKIEAEIKAQK